MSEPSTDTCKEQPSIECDDGESRRRASVVASEVIEVRVHEIVSLERENTTLRNENAALKEQLRKLQTQGSTFFLDEKELARRHLSVVDARNTLGALWENGRISIHINDTEVPRDEWVIERVKYDLERRAREAIDAALKFDVTVVPSNALFYLVWSPEGKTPPRCRHNTIQEAKRVAESMKSRYGGEFYVVAVLGDISDSDQDIPF